nr:putative F-box protein At1g19160 [Ipomoea batatas]
MENCIIPRDVVIEILAQLSVRSLMQFKCVCKFFYSLIKSDNHFKHKHFEISRARRDYVVFQHEMPDWGQDRGFGLVYKESDCDEIGCADLIFPTSRISEVRYADGMFCLITHLQISVDNYVWDISIWNPSTREIKKMQNIKALDGFSPEDPSIFGFGLSSNMMGKVVMIWIIPDPIVMVYSQGDNNSCGWKRFSHSLIYPNVNDRSSNLYLKGKYYWLCTVDQNHLLWFDFDDETFGKIELPKRHSNCLVLSAMKDTIALISGCIDPNQLEIWTMNEHNNVIRWNKYASVEWNEYTDPLRIWNLGAHLLVYGKMLQLPGTDDVHYVKHFSSYDLITQEKKTIYNVSCYICRHPPFVYSESLKSF